VKKLEVFIIPTHKRSLSVDLVTGRQHAPSKSKHWYSFFKWRQRQEYSIHSQRTRSEPTVWLSRVGKRWTVLKAIMTSKLSPYLSSYPLLPRGKQIPYSGHLPPSEVAFLTLGIFSVCSPPFSPVPGSALPPFFLRFLFRFLEAWLPGSLIALLWWMGNDKMRVPLHLRAVYYDRFRSIAHNSRLFV